MAVIDLCTVTTVSVRKKSARQCRCMTVVCDEQTRMLECRQCGRVIDPFDWIWKVGQQQDRMVFDSQALRTLRDQLADEIGELKKERTNLKAQIKRAKEKLQ